MLNNLPKVSIWVTSTGRFDLVVPTIETFIDQCTYPNYEIVIVESQMTPDSLKFFDTTSINEEKTEEYLRALPNKYSDVKFKIFIQPWKRLGAVYNQLLDNTGSYFINLEDDALIVADPAPQFIDAIKMLQDDPKLLGLRMDLRDDTVYSGSPRFQGTKEAAGIQFVYWDWCSGGAQFMDAEKVRDIGRYTEDHPDNKYVDSEIDQTAKMRAAGMCIGISLKYYGFWAHNCVKSIQGLVRTHLKSGYQRCIEKGWFGDGKNRRPLR